MSWKKPGDCDAALTWAIVGGQSFKLRARRQPRPYVINGGRIYYHQHCNEPKWLEADTAVRNPQESRLPRNVVAADGDLNDSDLVALVDGELDVVVAAKLARANQRNLAMCGCESTT